MSDTRCEWEFTTRDFDGSWTSYPCGGLATTTVNALALGDTPGDQGFTMDVCDEHAQALADDDEVEVESVTALEWPEGAVSVWATCQRCQEQFVPGGADDLVHTLRADEHTECGGVGILMGAVR